MLAYVYSAKDPEIKKILINLAEQAGEQGLLEHLSAQ